MKDEKYIRCEFCGRFIGFADLESGDAVHQMVTPDSEVSCETFESICRKCKPKQKESRKIP